jgi:penicillin G amidase
VPEAVRSVLPALSMKKVIDWLVAPDRRFGGDPIAARDALLARSLEEAVAGLRERLGPDMSGWRYGQPRYEHALIRHPLSAAVSPDLRRRFDVGPLPRGGNAYTVNSTGSGDNQTSGASFRIIAAVGDWDASVGTNTPGQGGEPGGPYYSDLFEPWARDRYFPVLYSRERVAAAGVDVLRLLPAEPPVRARRPGGRRGDRRRQASKRLPAREGAADPML